jgi:2-methylcitrate dehydratase PrpD
MAKVKVSASTDLDRHYPKYWSGRVAVRLLDGQSYSEEVIIPKGESGNPMTQSEVEEKFLSLAGPALGDQKARSAIDRVSSLESLNSLRPLLTELKLSG